MSDPTRHEDSRDPASLDPRDEQELASLRESYRQHAPSDEPSELVDARLRQAARDAIGRKPERHRQLAGWSGIVALAATIGFALVLVPNVFMQQPAQVAQEPATLQVELADEARSAEEESQESAKLAEQREASARRLEAADRSAARLAAAPAPDSMRLAEKTVEPATEEVERDVMQSLNAATANGELDLAALRHELRQAPEAEWRATLVALRDSQRRPDAEALLAEYRQRFDLPETLTLDQLVVDTGGR